MKNNIQQKINDSPMTKMQLMAVGICLVINMLDGFDVLVIAFTAPEISREWGLSPQSLGLLFGSGLFGMAAGSLFLAPYADRFGRRWLILVCLIIISVGMFLSAFAQSSLQLALMRALTGFGIGGALASLTTIVSEYSSDKRRSFSISLLEIGYPIGATIGGSIAVFLIFYSGWRSVFVFAAVMSTLMIPVVLYWLPESIDFLVARRPRNALEKINRILRQMKYNKINNLPEETDQIKKGTPGVTSLLSPENKSSTLFVWLSFFMVMLSFYFVLNWTPKLLVDAGLRVEEGVSGSIVMNFGGILGGILIGYLATFIPIKRLLIGYMLGCAIAMTAFGLFGTSLTSLLILGFVIGFFIFGSMIGLYIITPQLYAASIRNTGMGWAIGTGRIGAIIGPTLAGALLATGMDPRTCFFIFALPLLIASISSFYIGKTENTIMITEKESSLAEQFFR